MLIVGVVCAISWVLFLADDKASDFLKSKPILSPVLGDENIQEPLGKDKDLIINFKPAFDIVRVGRKGTGVIAGRAQPHSDVQIFAENKGNQKLIGEAIADRNGEWVLIFDEALADGPSELSLKSKMRGAFEIQSSEVVIVVVPKKNLDNFMSDEDNGVVAALISREGVSASRILQRSRTVNIQDLSKGLALDAIDYSSEGKIDITGRASSGVKIRIYLDQVFLKEALTNDNGLWHYSARRVLDDEEHVVRIDQLLLGDDVEVRIEQSFIPFKEINFKDTKGSVIVRPGNSLWHIARKLYGKGYHYTIIFSVNRALVRDPDLIYPGQKFNLPLKKDMAHPDKKIMNDKENLAGKIDQKLKKFDTQLEEIKKKISPKKK